MVEVGDRHIFCGIFQIIFRGIARSKLTTDRFVPMDYEKHQVYSICFVLGRMLVDV